MSEEELKQAADKYVESKELVLISYPPEYIDDVINDMKIAFMAGTEWMAGQGGTVTDAYVVELNEDKGLHWLRMPGSQLCDALKNFNIGDKVNVQIRKK